MAPETDDDINQPRLGPLGWLRWVWRQLTSMRTALFLLLLLAVAAVPGSLVPQTSADPNGVSQYKVDHPALYPILKNLQVFDTYTSVWFSAIYLLLFVSLVGCIIPRTSHHLKAMLAPPPRTPARLSRLDAYTRRTVGEGSAEPAELIERARRILRSAGYRTIVADGPRGVSVSAERGYLRETGNLVFHIALVGVLLTIGVGGGFQYTAQRIVLTGQTYVNTLVAQDSISPGRFFSPALLAPYSVRLDHLSVDYEKGKAGTVGQPLSYTAHVTATEPGRSPRKDTIKVNDPLVIGGTDVYLLGNGYAPTITVRNAQGKIAFRDSVPFLPQDANLTSQGVVKVTDGLSTQVGMVGFFYPTAGKSTASGGAGALASTSPALGDPELTLMVYKGDLGIDNGRPESVYSLDPDHLTQIAGPGTKTAAIELKPGQSERLPDGLGSITFSGVKRYASLTINHDPTQIWVLVFAILILAGLLTSLFVPRRRVWVRAHRSEDGTVLLEYAGLARGEDPGLNPAVQAIAERHGEQLD